MIEKIKIINHDGDDQEGNLATSRAAGPSTATPTSCQGILWQNSTGFLRKKNIKMSIKHKDDKSDIGQPWCGESVRIVKLGHLGLVEVPHNPVHVILIITELEFVSAVSAGGSVKFLPAV